MENPLLRLSEEEHRSFTAFNRKLAAWIAFLYSERDRQKRETGEVDDALIDSSGKPSDEDYFAQEKLWWKAFTSEA